MSTENYTITTQALHIGYHSKGTTNSIASNLNLHLASGQLISLVGTNGVGKSTLLRTLTGIQKPLQGVVFLNDKNIHDIPTTELAQELSLVLTEKLPPNNLTVYELIALGRQPYTNWLGQLSETDHEKIKQAIAPPIKPRIAISAKKIKNQVGKILVIAPTGSMATLS